jgi:hypothetical protein
MQMSSLLKEVGGGGVTPLLVTSFQAEHISFKCLLTTSTKKKKVCDFPVPSLDVTNQTLPGRENR